MTRWQERRRVCYMHPDTCILGNILRYLQLQHSQSLKFTVIIIKCNLKEYYHISFWELLWYWFINQVSTFWRSCLFAIVFQCFVFRHRLSLMYFQNEYLVILMFCLVNDYLGLCLWERNGLWTDAVLVVSPIGLCIKLVKWNSLVVSL